MINFLSSSTVTSSENNLKGPFPFKCFNAYGKLSVIYLLIFLITLTKLRSHSADVGGDSCFDAKLFL
jgi:hypothetical protein